MPISDGEPNYNLIVPAFIIERLPDGVVGLGLVALFAAAMSSLDSVLNALSATTMEDFIRRGRSQPFSKRQELWLSRAITAIWGVITLAAAFFVGDIAPTVLEAINKIGSLINGPILAVFALGVFSRRCNGMGALLGLLAGFIADLALWLFAPSISWLWWNVSGLVITLTVGQIVSIVSGDLPHTLSQNIHPHISRAWLISCFAQKQNKKAFMYMGGWFVILLVVMWALQIYFA